VVKGDEEFVRSLVPSPNKMEDRGEVKEGKDKDKERETGLKETNNSVPISNSKDKDQNRDRGSSVDKDLSSPLWKKDGGKNR